MPRKVKPKKVRPRRRVRKLRKLLQKRRRLPRPRK